MVRRKKMTTVVASPPRTRRLTRASTSKVMQSPTNLENESNISETSGKQQECENDSQDCSNLATSPMILPRHKNFGKYRCLSTKNSLNRNSDACASDSDILNNVEVKVVDPCASSESENSNSLEATNIANRLGGDSSSFRSFSRLSRSDRSSNSGSPVTLKPIPSIQPENLNTQNSENSNITLKTQSFDTQIPDPTLSIIPNDDPRRSYKSPLNNFTNILGNMSSLLKMNHNNDDEMNYVNNYSPANTGDDSQESLERMSNGDTEEYTIYEIIGEDPDYQDTYQNSEEPSKLYSNNESPSSPSENVFFNTSPKNTADDETSKNHEESENTDKTVLEEFENKMSNISLSSQDDSCANSELAAANYQDNSNSNDSRSIAAEKDNLHNDNISNNSQISNEEKKIDELMNAAESCSTPNSMMSEEENQTSSKTECENLIVEKSEVYSTDSSSSSSTGVRRSSRIKTINVLKQRSKGYGLVKNPLQPIKDIIRKTENNKLSDNSNQPMLVLTPQNSPVFSIPSSDSDSRPVKVKSRWRRSSEMEMGSRSPITPPLNSPNSIGSSKLSSIVEINTSTDKIKNTEINYTESDIPDRDIQERLDQFQCILINDYHCEKTISKEAKKMTCDCFLTKEEFLRGELGCGEDCLNRLLMIECNSRCPVGDRCTNRRFQSNQYAKLRVIKTEKKGLGIQASVDISGGEFLMEYVGEVLNWQQFNQRAQEYSSDKNTHHYFMSLKGDAVIDATLKGNISRFINHSCDPNAETQKWTVNGDLRIGFFSKRDIKAGDEITFDYQFQRYGKEGLRCFCEASNCRGWIGEEPDDATDEEEEIDQETDKNDVKVEDDEIKESLPEKDVEADSIKSDNVPIVAPIKEVKKKYKRRQFTKRPFNEILQEMDLEEEMKNLNRSGIKNQSHTLSLCRAMVRAKHTKERVSLLKLLASADLPCRRLFLDYRGLRLLAPWCENTDTNFRLEMLNALVKLPIPNKTVLKENKIYTAVEKWLEEASPKESPVCSFNKDDSSNDSMPGTPVLINEKTGLPIENYKAPAKLNSVTFQDALNNESLNKKSSCETSNHTSMKNKKINRISKELIEQWTTLPEVFKIPKKERIQLMKEHERQANEPNEPQLTIEKESDCEKERWEERYSRHDKEKKRSLLPSPDTPRRNQIRLDDRVLASIPTMSKEERRRDFAARVAHQEKLKRIHSTGQPILTMHSVVPHVPPGPILTNHWIPPDQVTHLPYSGINNPAPPGDYSMPEYAQADYIPMDYMPPQNSYPYGPPPQHVYPIPSLNTSIPPPVIHPTPNYNQNYIPVPYPNHSYNPSTPIMPSPSFQNIPLPPGTTNLQRIPPPLNPALTPTTPQPIPSLGTQPIPTVVAMQTTPVKTIQPVALPQPIPTLVPSSAPPCQYPLDVSQNEMDLSYYPPIQPTIESLDVNYHNRDSNTSITLPIIEKQDNTNINDVVRWSSVRLPSRWRSMKDARGRTYYYHVKFRISQWTPPIYSPTLGAKEEISTDEEEQEDATDETENLDIEDERPAVMEKLVEGVNGIYQVIKEDKTGKMNGLVKGTQIVTHVAKKRRLGLATERIISPRNEEDKIASKLEMKRYKERKEKMRRRKELGLAAAGCPDSLNKYIKRFKSSKHKKAKVNDVEATEKEARRIKEVFRASMARVMVHHLDPYRRDDCIIGRITNTPDFKHLARKLTHFVMLKELKHCQSVNDLKCNDSVKQKAKEFVKKYMAKFGAVYQRPPDEMEC